MDFGKSVMLLVSLVLFSIWIGMIWKAEEGEKLAEICHPVELVTHAITRVTTGLVGYTPNWTLNLEASSVKHCYYLAATFMKESVEGGEAEGGVRR